jgi:hypothetical protein
MQLEDERRSDMGRIKVFKSWGCGQEPRVPSAISYAATSSGQQQWGFNIEADAPAFRRAKLALHSRSTIRELEDLQDLVFSLPQLSKLASGEVDQSQIRYLCKTPEDIISDYLQLIATNWEDSVRSRFSTVLDTTPIDLIITHPPVRG